MRAEFNMGDRDCSERLHMSREGGCFISYFKGFLLFLLAAIVVVIVALAVHYLATSEASEDSQDKRAEDELHDLVLDLQHKPMLALDRILLPRTVLPTHYRLKIEPTLATNSSSAFTFNGTVRISVTINGTSVDKITLHVKRLHIDVQNVRVTRAIAQSPPLTPLAQVAAAPAAASAEPKPALAAAAPPSPPMPPSTMMPTSAHASITTVAPQPESRAANDTSPVSVNESPASVGNASEPLVPKTTTPSVTTVTPPPTSAPPVPTTTLVSVPAKPAPTAKSPPPPGITYNTVEEVRILRHNFLVDLDKYEIYLDRKLNDTMNYTVVIPFSGVISEELEGLYRASYEEDNSTIWYAATRFEPTFARTAFPCLDEPALKARFTISIARQKHMMSLSNMPRSSSEPMLHRPGWMWDHYKRSPLMSTYLVAFIVGEFIPHQQAATSPNTTELTVWTRRSVTDQAAFAAGVAPRILAYFADFFHEAYPLPKVDIMAIPQTEDGVQNFGLIIKKEDYLLLPNVANTVVKEAITIVLGHDLAQQWIGSLVTIKWWTDAWIQEGLASYLELFPAEMIDLTSEAKTQYLMSHTHRVLHEEQFCSDFSPEEVDVNEHSAFLTDSASIKAACIFHMLENSVTSPVFQKAISTYMDTWKFKNANHNDLWAAFGNPAIGNMTVKEFMDTWTRQSGLPMVHVERNYTDGSILVRQDKMMECKKDQSSIWHIPISYVTAENPLNFSTFPQAWMNMQKTITLHSVTNHTGNASSWILFNVQQAGLYRVNYDRRNWEYLRQALIKDPNTFPVLVRAQLVDDAFNLAQIGLLNYSMAFNLSLYLVAEENYLPWLSFIEDFKFLNEILSDMPDFGRFQNYISKLVMPQYELRKSQNSTPEPIGKTFIVRLACDIETPDCLSWAAEWFARWVKTANPDHNNPIPDASRATVYCAAIAVGGRQDWEFLWARATFLQDQDSNNFVNALRGLACSSHDWILRRYLQLVLIEDHVKPHSIIHVLSAFKRKYAVDVLFQFVRRHFDVIFNKFNGTHELPRILQLTLGRLSTQDQLHELLTLYSKKSDKLQSHAVLIDASVMRIKAQISWINKYVPSIITWLRQNVATTTG